MKRFLSLIGVSLILTGCSQTIVINEDDAMEICLDAAGYFESDVGNLNVQKADIYTVSFDSKDKDYQFKVNNEGIIVERNIEELKEPVTVEKKKEKKVKDKTSKVEEKAYNNALLNWGISSELVSDYSVNKEKDDSLLVRIQLHDGRKFVTITNAEGKPTSSYRE